MSQHNIPLKKMVSMLYQLCKQTKTGTLFILTEDERSARITLKDGKISSVFCFGETGYSALQSLTTITHGGCSFLPDKVYEQDKTLPSTQSIVKMLIAFVQSQTEEASTPINKAAQPKAATQSISAREKVIIENCLTEYLGTMASIVCDEHLNSTSNIDYAIHTLSDVVSEIAGNQQASKFKQDVRAKL